jgi:hypothetical protein
MRSGDDMNRTKNFLVVVFLAFSFAIGISGSGGQNEPEPRPFKEYFNEALAKKHLVPDSEGREDPRFSDRLLRVSMIRLIANPERYHGKPVRVEGFLTVGFEDNAIYLSREDAGYLITKNGLWVTILDEDWERLGKDPRKFKDSYVLIEGVFDKDSLGHLGAFSGSIREVWRVQELRNLRQR